MQVGFGMILLAVNCLEELFQLLNKALPTVKDIQRTKSESGTLLGSKMTPRLMYPRTSG